MIVRSLSHIFPAGALQQPQPAHAVKSGQVMGTPANMAQAVETSEPAKRAEAAPFGRIGATLSAATHEAVNRLNLGG